MDGSNTRIVILGKTGVGKSSLANTIFGEEMFENDDSFNSGTRKCQAETKSVNGRSITLIDTPGFFDTDRSEEELKSEIVSCITQCSPGPHAFLIVLKLEKVTEQEQAVINKINQYFSEEAFKYATVVFTHGDQLREGQEIEDFVHQNEFMNDLLKKCGGRCHVIDNKYWSKNSEDKYRSNQLHVEELLKSIDKMVIENNGSWYTNEMLQAVEKKIQQEEEKIRLSPGDMSEKEIKEQAKDKVFKKLLIKLAGTTTGALLGALFGVVVFVGVIVTILNDTSEPVQLRQAMSKTAKFAVAAAAGTGTGAAATSGITLGTLTVVSAAGAVKGGIAGYQAAKGADTPREAAQRAAEAVKKEAQSALDKANAVVNRLSQLNVKQIQNL